MFVQPGEYANGRIEGAVNYPLSYLRQKIPELPKDKKLYVYCQVWWTQFYTAYGWLQRSGSANVQCSHSQSAQWIKTYWLAL